MNDTLQVSLDSGLYVPNVKDVQVRHHAGLVYVRVNDKVLEMKAPAAHKTGFALVKKAGEAMPGDFVKMVVNGHALNFPSKSAKQVGAALLRRADDADDFQQRTHR